jgi:hypothetical protein
MAMSSRSTTPEKQRARRELSALARVGIDVCNILASRVEGGELESAEQRVRTMLEERRVAATADVRG